MYRNAVNATDEDLYQLVEFLYKAQSYGYHYGKGKYCFFSTVEWALEVGRLQLNDYALFCKQLDELYFKCARGSVNGRINYRFNHQLQGMCYAEFCSDCREVKFTNARFNRIFYEHLTTGTSHQMSLF